MKIIFLHIPKAGGQTIHKIVENIYCADSLYSIKVVNGKLTTEEFISLSIEKKAKIKLLKGHMSFGLHKHFNDSNAKYITFFRDPVDRIISHYYYTKKTAVHYLHNKVVKENINLLEYALSDLSVELDNGQTRLISGIDSPINTCDENMLNTAISNLKNHFICFGLVEEFDKSLVLFKETLEWDSVPLYIKKNVNVNRKSIQEISSDVVEKIKKRNNLDVKLYQWAKNEFEEKINLIPDFIIKSQIFEASNRSYIFGYNEGYDDALKKHVLIHKIKRAKNKIKKKVLKIR